LVEADTHLPKVEVASIGSPLGSVAGMGLPGLSTLRNQLRSGSASTILGCGTFGKGCNFEKEKSKWENKLSAVGDVWKWCDNDHLSPKDMGLRTNNNVGTLFGY